MEIYRQITANNIELKEYPFLKELAMEAYLLENEDVLKLDKDNSVSMFFPENEKLRSQDLEEAYHDAGQFYWGRTNAFLTGLPIFSQHSRVVLLPRSRVQDIDTQEDWELAEVMYSVLEHSKENNRSGCEGCVQS